MTALCLELMDITKDWVSSFVMLCQAFAVANFSCCLFVGLSAFSFVFSRWNACSIWLKSGDWLGHCRIIHFFTFKNSWVASAVCFGSSLICTMKRRPINFAAFGWMWAESISLYTWEFFQLLLSSVTSSLNTSNPVPLEAMHAHAITLLHHVSQMMLCALDHELFQAFFRLIFISECFSRSGLAFLDVFWQSLIWPCLHLVVNPLYLL